MTDSTPEDMDPAQREREQERALPDQRV